MISRIKLLELDAQTNRQIVLHVLQCSKRGLPPTLRERVHLIVALILAAGEGSRIGTPKATLEVNGERFVDRAVSTFMRAGCSDVYVVLGAWVGEVENAKVIVNQNWKAGMGSSLRIGLSHISSLPDVESVLVSLVDLPGLSVPAVKKVLAEPGEIVISTYSEKPGHPVKFSRRHWGAIMESAIGDVGAREYLSGNGAVRFVEVGDLADGRDIDTKEDFAGLMKD